MKYDEMDKFQFSISLDDARFYHDTSFLLDTCFNLQIEDRFFPDRLWTDLAIPMLYLWAEELLKHKDSRQSTYYLHSMDGPYYLKIKQTGQRLQVEGVHDGTKATTQVCFHCSYMDFVNEIINCFCFLEKSISNNTELFQDLSVKAELLSHIDCSKKRLQSALLHESGGA